MPARMLDVGKRGQRDALLGGARLPIWSRRRGWPPTTDGGTTTARRRDAATASESAARSDYALIACRYWLEGSVSSRVATGARVSTWRTSGVPSLLQGPMPLPRAAVDGALPGSSARRERGGTRWRTGGSKSWCIALGVRAVSAALLLLSLSGGLTAAEIMPELLLLGVLVGAVHWGRRGGFIAAAVAVAHRRRVQRAPAARSPPEPTGRPSACSSPGSPHTGSSASSAARSACACATHSCASSTRARSTSGARCTTSGSSASSSTWRISRCERYSEPVRRRAAHDRHGATRSQRPPRAARARPRGRRRTARRRAQRRRGRPARRRPLRASAAAHAEARRRGGRVASAHLSAPAREHAR